MSQLFQCELSDNNLFEILVSSVDMDELLLEKLQTLTNPLPVAAQQALVSGAKESIKISSDTDTAGTRRFSRFGGDRPLELITSPFLSVREPMDFLADIHLSELPQSSLLPREGRLLVFVGDQDLGPIVQSYCVWIQEHDDLRTIHVPAPRRDNSCSHQAERVLFESSISLPEVEVEQGPQFGCLCDIYDEFGANGSRLLGHKSLEVDEFLKSHNMDDEWVLLLQVDSFYPIKDLIWWDNARLQIIIKQSDFELRQFKTTVGLIVDCG